MSPSKRNLRVKGLKSTTKEEIVALGYKLKKSKGEKNK